MYVLHMYVKNRIKESYRYMYVLWMSRICICICMYVLYVYAKNIIKESYMYIYVCILCMCMCVYIYHHIDAQKKTN